MEATEEHPVCRASDRELCGHVLPTKGEWQSLAVFGGLLATHPTRDEAERHVINQGLASLAERWSYRESPDREWQVACIQEASRDDVRLALDYYSLPGVPTRVVTRADLNSGASLRRRP